MKKSILYSSLLCLLVGCGSGKEAAQKHNADTLLFNVEINPVKQDQLGKLLLSEIADSIRYTQLKTDGPITFFLNGGQAENFIPVLSNSIQLYRNSGELLCNVGSVGRGHGEYIRPQWTISEKNKEVYVYSDATLPGAFLVYGTDGKYYRTIANEEIKPSLDKILPVGNNVAFTMPSVIPNYPTAELVLFDPITNRVVDSLPDYNKIDFEEPYVNIAFPVSVESIYRDTLYYMSVFSDTLYRITPTQINPLGVFDFGQYKYEKESIKLRGEQYKSAITKKIKPIKMLATKKALYIQFRYADNLHTLSWITKLDLFDGRAENYDIKFTNDLDGGLDYSLPLSGISMVIDIETILPPASVQTKTDKNRLGPVLTEIVNGSSENSNSVLMTPIIK